MARGIDSAVPGFIGDPMWVNRWYLGTSEDVRLGIDGTGHLQLIKHTDSARHLVLQASPSDLHELPKGSGVAVAENGSFSAWLNAVTGERTTAQLVIHEFDRRGHRLARWTVSNKQRGLFTADQSTSSIVLSIRVTGQGSVTIRNVEFNPFLGTAADAAGFHVLGSVPVEQKRAVAGAPELGVLMNIRRALFDNVPLHIVVTKAEAPAVARSLIAGRHFLEAQAVVGEFDLYQVLGEGDLRKLFLHGRRTGFSQIALRSIRELIGRRGEEKDKETGERWYYECKFHQDPWSLLRNIPQGTFHDPQGPVLHMVGKSFPETQTGYTLRTKYTVDALRRGGIDSVIAVQAAGNYPEGLVETVRTEVDGTAVFQFGGFPSSETNREVWLRSNARELYQLVKQVKPRVIHAHSDFINGVLATHVGEATNIPVVYETRGFWEETWLSRISQANGWEDIDRVTTIHGYPDLYLGRRNSERRVRERADRIVTLAQTMKDFILQESPGGAVRHDDVHLARNAVDGEEFPIGRGSAEIRSSLGLEETDVVLGYVSSMVEYEGIEVLISAYRKLREVTPNVRLLLVGGGNHLEALKEYAAGHGLNDVIFTDSVPHQEIIDYYHAIDVFVVPRRRTRVTELVTPLKPFEAFSTGRPVVMSDVSALAEIAQDSGAAGRLFRADDSDDLVRALSELIHDSDLCERLGRQGADWVRRERSWDANVSTYARLYQDLQNGRG